ncbi:MAG: hypothetical protein PHE54_04535 [Bacilli bacterium]|nr:hypothetical protein [Bacilli bacterium]
MLYYGGQELYDIPIDGIIVLPQVRRKKNVEFEEIAASIENGELITNLNVARLTLEILNEYVEVLSEMNKCTVNVDYKRQPDGFYYVLIAGHTRLEAMKHIQDKRKEQVVTAVKIHKINSIMDIIRLQLEENLHSKPSIEERANTIVKMYQVGKRLEFWSDDKSFKKAIIGDYGGRMSTKIVTEALSFSTLSPLIQRYIFNGNLPYAVGVEMGKNYAIITEYEKMFGEYDYSIESRVELQCSILITKMQNAKSIRKCLEIIASRIQYFKSAINKDDNQSLMEFWNQTSKLDEQFHMKMLLNEYRKAHLNLTHLSVDTFAKLYQLDTEITGIPHTDELNSLSGLYSEHQAILDKKKLNFPKEKSIKIGIEESYDGKPLASISDGSKSFLIHVGGSDIYWTSESPAEDNTFRINSNNEFYQPLLELINQARTHDYKYSSVFNNNDFTWISEAREPEISHKLIIHQGKDFFDITFNLNPLDMYSSGRCSICFCQSGSRNQTIACLFSELYNRLCIHGDKRIKHIK